MAQAMARDTDTLYMCPFVTATSATVPAYCNYVAVGSKIDTSLTSIVTQAKESFVGADNDFPVTMGYSIAAKGLTYGSTTLPMKGSANAWVSINLKEARNNTGTGRDSRIQRDHHGKRFNQQLRQDIAYQSGFILY